MPRPSRKVNLFAYGSLRNPAFIESITGEMHEGRPAVLTGYKKFYTPLGFPFILPHPDGRVYGKCYFGITAETLQKIDHFECEGTLYDRRRVTLSMHGRAVGAQAYIANLIHIRRAFGPNMDLALVEKAEKFIEEHAGERIKILMMNPSEPRSESELAALTRQELFGAEVSNLLNMLLLDKYISDYTIDSRLKIRGMPSLAKIRQDPEKLAHAPHYLSLAMRFILLNQLEESFRHQFRSEFFVRMPYSRFTLSLLAALKLHNRHQAELDAALEEVCTFDGPSPPASGRDYFDYSFRAVQIAHRFYRRHSLEAGFIVREILLERQHGIVPMGAELEFSDFGRLATRPERPPDLRHNHFRYFYDYDLERRSWKLGGHVDDHKYSLVRDQTEGGFLEYSLGKTEILERQSQPVTDDPRVLAGLIEELISFTRIRPHSLHLSFQDLEDKPWRKDNDPEMLQCLLLLGGDFGWSRGWELVERRIHDEETVDPWGNLHVIRENFHSLIGSEEGNRPLRVMEYQFPRLRAQRRYEPLIVALKGFHLGYRPRPMSSVATCQYHDAAAQEIETLRRWASSVRPLAPHTLSAFVGYLEKGLEGEKRGKRAHAKRYMHRMLFEIERALFLQNAWIREELARKERREPEGIQAGEESLAL
ncbi:MAG: gamma-glutamylcyclotransferase family protein [bacterium]